MDFEKYWNKIMIDGKNMPTTSIGLKEWCKNSWDNSRRQALSESEAEIQSLQKNKEKLQEENKTLDYNWGVRGRDAYDWQQRAEEAEKQRDYLVEIISKAAKWPDNCKTYAHAIGHIENVISNLRCDAKTAERLEQLAEIRANKILEVYVIYREALKYIASGKNENVDSKYVASEALEHMI